MKRQITGFGKAELLYDLSKTKTIDYIGKYNQASENHKNEINFNNNNIGEALLSNNQLFDQKIVFTNRLKEKTVYLLSGRYIDEKTPQNYQVNKFLFSDLFPDNADNAKQFSQNQMQFAGVEAHLLNKKNNGDLFEIKIGNQLRRDHLTTSFELYNQNNIIAKPINYQNQVTYQVNELFLSGKYVLKVGNVNYNLQSDLHQISNQTTNNSLLKKQNNIYLIPKIGMEWYINNKNKLISSYSYNTVNSSVLDVNPSYVQTGFRSFSKGLEDMNQLNASNLYLNYTFGDWGDQFFANSYLVYTKNNEFYSTNSNITQNYSQIEKIIIKDRNFFSIVSNLNYYFKPIKSNLKLTFSATKSNFKNVIYDSELREIQNFYANYGFEIQSGLKEGFNYHLGSKWTYNNVKTEAKSSSMMNKSFADFNILLSKKINIQLQTERYYFGNFDKKNQQYYFLNFEGKYEIKENKLNIFLSGNNLFNTKFFRNYTISDINISNTEYRLQPIFVMIKMEYRF